MPVLGADHQQNFENEVILSINSGSSNIKFSIFRCQQELNLLYHGLIQNVFDSPYITIFNKKNIKIEQRSISSTGYEAGLLEFFNWFEQLPNSNNVKAIGHRVVHGGKYFSRPALVTDEVIKKITSLIPLAPLHQSHNLQAIKIIKKIYPKLQQVVCFDTTFHLTQEKLATLFAIPHYFAEEGIIRYGFHGISYEYIASVIVQSIGEIGNKRVIVAHLGNGASMCAMHKLKSVATTMGMTALDGLMMGTRCGSIDPGILLYLLQEKSFSLKKLENLLYNESGLQGVSGISYDMRELLASTDVRAKEGIDLFCYRAAMEVGSLAVALNGCDALVFTAGIGENVAPIREKICQRLTWMDIELNEEANLNNAVIISSTNSKIKVSVIPTNEEYMIAKHTWNIVGND